MYASMIDFLKFHLNYLLFSIRPSSKSTLVGGGIRDKKKIIYNLDKKNSEIKIFFKFNYLTII